MKAKCVDTGGRASLTFGKIYDATERGCYLEVVNDCGVRTIYYKRRFQEVEEDAKPAPWVAVDPNAAMKGRDMTRAAGEWEEKQRKKAAIEKFDRECDAIAAKPKFIPALMRDSVPYMPGRS